MSTNRTSILLAFAAIYIIWGSTYVALRFGIATIPPFLFSGVRFFIAGSLLFTYCLLTKKPLPDVHSVISNSICGILMLGGGTVSVAWAEQYVPSGTAAIIVTFLPFWFVLLDKRQWSYYFNNKLILIGLVLGFIGVMLLTTFSSPDTNNLNKPGNATPGIIVILAGGFAWTIGSLLSKYKATKTGLLINGSLQMLATSIVCLFVSFVSGELRSFSIQQVSAKSIAALCYLIFMGSHAAYLSYIYLLREHPAVEVSTYVYVNPVIAVLLGAIIAHEFVSFPEVLSLMLILCGVLLVNLPKYIAWKKT